jgi:hypothetical protein
MQVITIQMTLEEAKDLSKVSRGADPLGIFTGSVMKRIDTAARAALAKASQTPADSSGQTPVPVVQSAEK